MKAAVLYKGARELKVEEVPQPQPGPGEVLVKVAACGVCHTDLHYLDHGVPTFKEPPMIPGHEISGTVAELGAGVEKPAVGTPVLVPAVLTCGQCEACRRGRENICRNMVMVGNNIDGGYAEYLTVPAKDLIPLPPELPLKDCAIIADALTTPYHAVVNRGQIRPGQQVAVFGCGGVGMNVVQFAALSGAIVHAVDLVPEKLALARKLGAAYTYSAADEDVAKQVRKASGGCDVAFEAIGKPAVMLQAMATLKPGGRFVMVGYSAEKLTLAASRIMFRELEIVGSLGCRPVDYQQVVQLTAQGKVQLEPLITHRFPLEDINAAMDELRQGAPVIRNLIEF